MTARTRLIIVVGLLCCGLTIAGVKSGMLQLLRGEALKNLAEKQYLRSTAYTAGRGDIYDREGKLLSTSVPVESIYAEPRRISNPSLVLKQIVSTSLKVPKKTLETLSSDRAFTWLARRVDPNTATKIKAMSLEGIGLAKEEQRFYPNHALLGQTLGLVSIDGHPLSGIERAYNEYLQPKSFNTMSLNDARGVSLRAFIGPDINELKGNDLYLTIDRDIQYIAEEALLTAMADHGAKGGWAIVLKPKTGEVLALANAPLMNPNNPKTNPDAKRNNAIARTGEPGSTFKIITFAAAFDAEVLSREEKIFCENGRWDLGYMVVRDISKKGWLTPGEIFKYSSNIGTYKIAQRIGKEKLSQTIKRFGFGELPGLNLVEEARGHVSDHSKWGQTRFANVSFGYGIMASSFQLALAAATIANGGVRIPPQILLRIKTPDGREFNPLPKAQKVRVISEKTAAELTRMMIDDTNGDGTGKRAAIPGILVAGKTGTAEKIDGASGRYAKNLNMASFVGFAPADNPEIVAMVVIDEPKGISYGGVVAAPAWQKIVTAALIKQGLLFTDQEGLLSNKSDDKNKKVAFTHDWSVHKGD